METETKTQSSRSRSRYRNTFTLSFSSTGNSNGCHKQHDSLDFNPHLSTVTMQEVALPVPISQAHYLAGSHDSQLGSDTYNLISIT